MSVKYLRLFDPTQQFQLKGGQLNTSGRLFVYLESTDDFADLYDENGTKLQQPLILDNNGRAHGVFVDAVKLYWIRVQDRYGQDMFTVRKMTPCGGGGMSVDADGFNVVSSDGSINVEVFYNAGVKTFDLGIAQDSGELLEWGKAATTSLYDGMMIPVLYTGTMEGNENGVEVYKNRFYHITSNFKVVPNGSDPEYKTLEISLVLNDGNSQSVITTRSYDIDQSLNDSVELEFSCDIMAPENGHLFWTITGAETVSSVNADMQIHRIYSGINAVPGSIASKVYVHEVASSKVDFDDIDHDINGQIVGINGSAIAGGGETGDYIPWSASSAFYPAYNPSGFVTDDECRSSYVSTASMSAYQKTADMTAYQLSGDYATNSSLSAKLDTSAFADVSGTFLTAVPAGFATESYVDSAVSSKLDATASSQFVTSLPADLATTGDVESAVSGKMDKSASADFYSTSNPSGFISTADLSDFATTAYVDSSVSGKLDVTAYNSSEFYPTSNPSGFISGVDLSDYAKESSLSSKLDASASSQFAPIGDYAFNSAVSGKLDSTAFADVSGTFLTAVPDGFATESYVDSAVSSKLDVTASSQFITALPTDLATTGDVASAVSGKLDNSASGEWYPLTGNPSGFLTAHQSLAGYATEQYVDSSVSGKLDSTAYDSAQFQLTADMSAYQTTADMSAYAFESSNSAKLDATAAYNPTFGYNSEHKISSIDGTAIVGGVEGEFVEKSATEVAIGTSASALQYSFAQGLSAYASGTSLAQGTYASASGKSVAQGEFVQAYNSSVAQGHYASALSASVAQGYSAYANGYSVAQGTEVSASSNSFVQGCLSTARVDSLAQGYHSTAESYSLAQGEHVSAYSASLAQGHTASASSNSFGQGVSAFADNASLAQGNKVSASNYSLAQGYSSTARNDSFAQGWGAVAVNSSVAQGNNCSASANSIAMGVSSTAHDWGRTFGLNLTADHSATVFGQYNNKGNGRASVTGDSAAFVIGDGTATDSRHDLMLVTKNGELTMFSGTADTTGIGLVSSITSISSNLSNYQTTANMSSYLTTADMSGYITKADVGIGEI